MSAAQVREVLAKGRSAREGVLSVKYVVNKGDFAAAVVAPKSVAKRAVDRNRLRRALYRSMAALPKSTSAFRDIKAVFFIQRMPKPLQPTLGVDLMALIKKLNSSHV